MELNNIIFSLFLIFFGYFFSKYLLLIFKKSKSNLLIDNQFRKVQAFHENSTYRLGGVIIFSLLILVFLYLHFSRNIFLSEYVSFCILFFLLGLIDDLKIYIAPKFRLLIMIAMLIILVISNEIYIKKNWIRIFKPSRCNWYFFTNVYLFKCKLLKGNNIAKKLDADLAFYRILNKSRSSQRLKNIYWLWHINKNYNNLNFFDNIISIFFISINSIKKYGIK